MLDCQSDASLRPSGRPSPCREAFEQGAPCRHEEEPPSATIDQITDTLLFAEYRRDD